MRLEYRLSFFGIVQCGSDSDCPTGSKCVYGACEASKSILYTSMTYYVPSIILCCWPSISIIHIFNLEKYYKSDTGSNCPAQNIITEEHPCVLATFRFDKSNLYNGEITDSRYPAGCFENWRGDFTFNEVIDTSETKPELFGSNVAICQNQGKWENGHYLNTLIK